MRCAKYGERHSSQRKLSECIDRVNDEIETYRLVDEDLHGQPPRRNTRSRKTMCCIPCRKKLLYDERSYQDHADTKTHKRKLVMQGPLAHPRSILCCAIRMAGGWHNDGMDQEKFLMTCYESNCDVYSEAQLGVSSPCNEWASGGEADAHFCRRCTSSLAVISQ